MATLASLSAALVLWAAPAPAPAAAGVPSEPSVRIALRWQAVAGAVVYEIQIATEPSFAAPLVAERVEVPGYRWAEIPSARHYWRVRSIDRDGRASPWSEVKPIEAALIPPDPVSPADGARFTWDDETPTATFACTRSEVLRAYTVELARDADFGVVDVSLTAASPTLRVPLPGLGVFWWRTRGTALSGRETPSSRVRRIEVLVGPPRPLAPGPSEAVPFGPVLLRWQAWAPVPRWRVSVEHEGEPAWQAEVAQAEAKFVPRTPGRHRWTAAAVTQNGTVGPKSEPRELEVTAPPPLPAPRPLAPGEDAVVGEDDPSAPVALAWEPIPQAAGYQVQVGAPGGLEAVSPLAAPETPLSLSLPSGPLAWRARALDQFGGEGAWSEPRLFFNGRQPSARAEIEPGAGTLLADGKDSTPMAIRLFDASGRRVRGAPITVTATDGRVEGLTESENGWTAIYVAPERAPPSNRSEIVVEDRGFTARVTMALRKPDSRWRLGLLAGWKSNLASASAPAFALEVLWHAPWLSDRVLLAARAGTWATSVTVPAQPGLPAPVEATARVFPLSVLGLLEWPVGRAAVYGGAGLGVHLTRLSEGPEASLEAAPSAMVLLGASGALGPGEVVAEVEAGVGRVDAPLGRLRTGGLLVGVGYRYRP